MNINSKKRHNHRGKEQYYQTKAHKRWREKVLAKSNGLCVNCKEKGIIKRATVADHIIPIKLGGDPEDVNNGQGLCKYHHDQKSAHERWMRDQ